MSQQLCFQKIGTEEKCHIIPGDAINFHVGDGTQIFQVTYLGGGTLYYEQMTVAEWDRRSEEKKRRWEQEKAANQEDEAELEEDIRVLQERLETIRERKNQPPTETKE